MAAPTERAHIRRPTELSPVYTFVSKAAAACVSLAATYGYAVALPGAVRSVFLIPSGFAFTAMYIWAVRRKAEREQPTGQVFLVLAMIVTSLVLHLLYLPAGLCCFVTLMVAQNELIYKPTAKREKRI
ncbi:hypothetical protein KFE25_007439 [Diacronema lutheri]|uniref:Uncharacterized protein n=1 Tax=Diacronema lutheri TaxID=2081491 RepID=A0A8J6CFA7_DIALT|nr:hypothetical protein KFE25_007439 [Diacronema lutheri]